LSGTKKVSPQESSSTGTPRELESPQALESWADDIAHLIDKRKEARPEALPEAEPIPEPRPEPAPTRSISTISPQDMTVPMIKVIEDGKEVVRPDVIQTVVQLGTLGQLARIRRSLERDHFKGKIDTRELPVTDKFQFIDLVEDWPNTPWVSFFIINHGPNTAKIQINGLHETWIKIRKNETRTINHSKADERIKRIAYQCDLGETALLEIEGAY